MQYPNLFSPIGVGPYSLRNRIVHTATVTAYGAEGRPTQKLIDHHRARALGGAAMIVTELMPVHYTSIANPFLVNVFDEGNLSLLELWAESVESAGWPDWSCWASTVMGSTSNSCECHLKTGST